ncbi:hypothetical protein CYMTET_9570 [Cymbomonas tetramitiformis]|uniref:Response regulatory domain-containing protein n=1 Tax=Cymbomonas tetramitiformis TaxID=36881 RepID=A0AAE0LFC4_9CHLO|nr:hypothetical protein CYMTET_9570 [Cymbomonas tetramitiformis]
MGSLSYGVQVLDIVLLCMCFCFYIYQFVVNKKCKFEVLYVSFSGAAVDIAKVIMGDSEPAVLILSNGLTLNWFRYFGWLCTCPVLLIHLSNLSGEEVFNVRRMMKLLVFLQIMLLFSCTSTITEGATRAITFTVASLSCGGIYTLAYAIFKEAYLTFPKKAQWLVLTMAGIFYTSWSMFGLLVFLGPEGANFWTADAVKTGTCIADIGSKQMWGFCGWWLRWKILRSGGDGVLEDVEESISYSVEANVLLVENDPVLSSLLSNKFEQMKYGVKVVMSKDDMLEDLKQHS